jgi:hypothetical protein
MSKTVFILGAIAGIILLYVIFATNTSGKPRYRKVPLLTENEHEFFGRLCRALPDHYIFPQIGIPALIESDAWSKKTRMSDFLRISQKRIDFGIFTRDLKIVAVVELDDRTHSTKKDRQRDDYLLSAGVRTIRFQSKQKPDEKAIANAIANLKSTARPAQAASKETLVQ